MLLSLFSARTKAIVPPSPRNRGRSRHQLGQNSGKKFPRSFFAFIYDKYFYQILQPTLPLTSSGKLGKLTPKKLYNLTRAVPGKREMDLCTAISKSSYISLAYHGLFKFSLSFKNMKYCKKKRSTRNEPQFLPNCLRSRCKKICISVCNRDFQILNSAT